jgi:hypothetical protein
MTAPGTALVVALLCMLSCGKAKPVDIEAKHPRYSPGQVWTYRSRPGEEQSRMVVLRVDKKEPLGFIIHIQVDGIAIKSTSAPDGYARTISHLPFSVASIDASVIKMERVGPVPDFDEGYRTWRDAFDQNKAGVWTTTIAGAISAMESALNQKK